MKKYMIADLIKQVKQEIPIPGDLEDAGIERGQDIPVDTEDIDRSNIDPDGNEFDASIGIVTYQPNGDGSFEVDISFTLGGSATYTMDALTLEDWINNPTGGYYNANVRQS
jgi:hypothetical protein